MGFDFTEKQKKVLNARHHNVLVSAAAGSGKTAVLVERIIRMITEPSTDQEGKEYPPLDIDRLLVVTFTRAAAAQMRERIAKAISDKLLEHPGDRHLQKQETLLHHAQITTIDSFCTFLLRNNFSDIDLDPGFRQMDETEATLLRNDVMQAYLDACYEKHDPDFEACVEYFCTGTNDKELEDLIFQLHSASDSHPDPAAWLNERRSDYEVTDADDLLSRDWMLIQLAEAMETLQGIHHAMGAGVTLAELPMGPAAYAATFQKEQEEMFAPFGILDPVKGMQEDERFLRNLADSKRGKTQAAGNMSDTDNVDDKATGNHSENPDMERVRACFDRISQVVNYAFPRMPAIRKTDTSVDPALKDQASDLQKSIKGHVNEIKEALFSIDLDTTIVRMQKAAAPLSSLIDLTLGYREAFQLAKQEKNAIDFSDLERYALQILLDRDEKGAYIPRKAALSYRAFFAEVLIDEYQDSNEVQELLLSTITGEAEGNYSRFMVGDVKQSIYRFRNARPEIFVDKFETYLPEEEARKPLMTERIDLDQNFRSRKQVLDAVNDVFFRVMRREIGGVEYSSYVSLKYGLPYSLPEGMDEADMETEKDPYETEILLVDVSGNKGEVDESTGSAPDASGSKGKSGGVGSGDADEAFGNSDEDTIAALSNKKKEALAIAQEIQRLVGVYPVTDSETHKLRPARYSDIVILLRSGGSWNDAIRDIFEKQGIPIFVDYKAGYFAAEEVREVLQQLRVIDNPMQDIPLYGAMHGYFGQFTEDEIGQIRGYGLWAEKMSRKLNAENAAPMDDKALQQAEDEAMLREEEAAENAENGDVTEPVQTSENKNAHLPLYEALKLYAGEEVEGITLPDDTAELPAEDGKNTGAKNPGEKKGSSSFNMEVNARLREKCQSFLSALRFWRSRAPIMPIHELLEELIDTTGYEDYITALPAGPQRKANLHSLIVKAAAFEQTAYTGLFRFLRYIDAMHQYEVDYGEANVLDEKADVVRLMTIHKSKGLEFPICFVAGLEGKFAFKGKDASGHLICDTDLGLGIDYVDTTLRARVDTLRKNVVAARIRRNSLGEELRILYVAMTRAKEKLYLCGFVNDAEKYHGKIAAALSEVTDEVISDQKLHLEPGQDYALPHLPVGVLSGVGNFLDLIELSRIPASRMTERVIGISDMTLNEVENQMSLGTRMETLDLMRNKPVTELPVPSLVEELTERFSFRYPHADLESLYTKCSVSDIKHAAIDALNHGGMALGSSGAAVGGAAGDAGTVDFDEEAYALFPDHSRDPYLPRFITSPEEMPGYQKKEEKQAAPVKAQPHVLRGAERGTAIHRGCELIDYVKWPDPSAVSAEEFMAFVRSQVDAGFIPKEYETVLTPSLFTPFLQSDVAARMAAAAQNSMLRREQPFVHGIPASRMNHLHGEEHNFPDSETILVQGIIDAFFIEEDSEDHKPQGENPSGKHIVVVDYKTDNVKTAQELIDLYQVQLDYYAEALEAMLGIPVTEKIIYSFRLQQEVQL